MAATEMHNSLIPSVSIEALVAKREAMVACVNRAVSEVQQLSELFQATTADNESPFYMVEPTFTVAGRFGSRRRMADGAPAAIKAIDAALWGYLLTKSGLRSFMDAKTREKWNRAIDELQFPEITVENVRATFQDLLQRRTEMFKAGVVSCFQSLSWDYKTNSPVAFGKRIVLNYVVDTWAGQHLGHACVSHGGANKLDDLRRVFCLLEGKPEPDSRQGHYHLLREAGWPGCGVVTVGDVDQGDGYYELKGFKNGNAHVKFLRPDLVDQLNRIVAEAHGAVLPPARD